VIAEFKQYDKPVSVGPGHIPVMTPARKRGFGEVFVSDHK